jgi:Flp pilus assembly protein TadG
MSPSKRMAHLFKARALSNADGTVAVEFALIAPVLIAIFFGVTELTDALETSSKVTSVASSAADLIAQDKAICNAEMTDVFSAVSAIMFPYESTGMQIRISSVQDNGDGTAKVQWSDAKNTSPRVVNSSLPGLPAGVIATGGSAIYAEVTFNYTSITGQWIKSVIPMQSNFYARPRQVSQVNRTVSSC